jgi:hypothetical protein
MPWLYKQERQAVIKIAVSNNNNMVIRLKQNAKQQG